MTLTPTDLSAVRRIVAEEVANVFSVTQTKDKIAYPRGNESSWSCENPGADVCECIYCWTYLNR